MDFNSMWAAYLNGFKQYADFKGKTNSEDFWGWIIINLIAIIVICLYTMIPYLGWFTGGILMGIYWLATLVPCMAITCRRLNDEGNKNTWLGYVAGLFGLLSMAIVNFTLEGNKK